MKTFVEHLNESKKVYSFKIGVAGELPENFENTMETALQKYSVIKMTTGKSTPIQERPLDFPQLKNMNVTYYEVDLTYPTTVQVLQEYIGQCCGVKQSHVIVRNPNEPQELYQQEPTVGEKGLALLQNEDMGGETAQDRVGTARVMDLLKELETARKERNNNYIGEAPVGESKDIGDVENTKSVVGA
jgi:hypothetical protein